MILGNGLVSKDLWIRRNQRCKSLYVGSIPARASNLREGWMRFRNWLPDAREVTAVAKSAHAEQIGLR